MAQAVIVTVPAVAVSSDVKAARGEFVAVLKTEYGAARKYAATLVAFFRGEGFGDDWVTMDHDEKGKAGDAMREERSALYADLKAAGHSNPSVKWKQIKGYAAEIIGEEMGETEGETEGEETEGSGNTKHTRSVQLRLVEDLSGLHKMLKREAKNLTDGQRTAALHIAAALADIGVDVNGL